MNIRPFEPADTAAVVALWHACQLVRPWNDPHKDIERKLAAADCDLFWVGEVEGVLVASVMGGYNGHRGSVNYLAVHPAQQGRGYGRELMQAMEAALIARGCPKLNLQVRQENTAVLAFYDALGYSEDRVVSLGKRLISDD